MTIHAMLKSLFYTKPIQQVASSNNSLRRCLTAFDLTLLGIGAIIGAGIFVLTGIAAATQAGPGIILSYLIAAIACGFSALSYAELASSVGGCGSAYGYAYAGLGELFAWIIGWDLLLEYGMVTSTVSIGWSGYMQDVLQAIGINLPSAFLTDPFHGGIMNLPAMLIIFLVATILSIGVKESARFNKVIVFIKLAIIALFIGIAAFHFNPNNWHPFLPFGFQGIVNGAALIFFAYIGFDAVSTAAEEAINPQKDLPLGIIASLVVCTLLYIIVSGLLTGVSPYQLLNVSSPVANVLLRIGYRFSAGIVAVGAVAGLTTVILVMYYGFTRIFLAMSRDGLLPQFFVSIHPRSQTPRFLIWVSALVMALIAGFIPINNVAQLVNIGTLAAFVIVCAGVIILRFTKPNMVRPFRTPASPIVPLLGIIFCVYLMCSLPKITWMAFLIWTVIGIFIYFGFSRVNSLLVRRSSVI